MMQNFNLTEFQCKHCGAVDMDERFLLKIDLAIEIAGIPFIVNSGFRCEQHNKAVGSTSTNHTTGHAADIQCLTSQARFRIIKSLFDVGFDRIGVHRRFIHVDDNPAMFKGMIFNY